MLSCMENPAIFAVGIDKARLVCYNEVSTPHFLSTISVA